MMNGAKTSITAFGLFALASACTAESVDVPFDSSEHASCSNEDGTNATMAALAAATAKELRRWQPAVDFRIGPTTWRLELTAVGKGRCTDGQCRNVQAILDFQKQEYDGKIVLNGGGWLKPDTFRDRLFSRYEAQMTCIHRVDNHDPSNCPAEAHDLAFWSATRGSCESDFWFHAYKAGTTNPLVNPAQLKNMLLWVGYDPSGGNSNPYLAFDYQGDDIKIDPTGGPVEGDPAASGACPAVCSKFSIANITGGCCSCNGSTGTTLQLAVPVALGGSPYMYACR